MTTSILYELFNQTVSGGTGIATYARNLTRCAQELGYRVEGLFHSERALSDKDSILSEIEFFDARKRRRFEFSRHVFLARNWAFGAPGGIRAKRLLRTGVVIDPFFEGGGPGEKIDSSFVARLFNDVARLHFKRYGCRTRLHVPTRPTLFHATQAIPIHVRGAVNIYTIHDLVPLRLPYATLDDKKFFLELTRHLCRNADHIVTVSEASRRDLIEIGGVSPDRVTNTYQTVSFPPALLEPSDDQVADFVARSFELDYKGYFLFYGALEPKKNVDRLIDAYLGSGSERPLVIAGGLGWDYEDTLARIEQATPKQYRIVGDRISFDRKINRLEHLPLSQLVTLIRGARAVLFPSLYEGFGLPVLESMLLGTPVMTSNVASLTEVAGDAALLADPLDLGSLTRGIAQLDADDDLRAELSRRGREQAKKFSPETYKSTLGALYRRLIGGSLLPGNASKTLRARSAQSITPAPESEAV